MDRKLTEMNDDYANGGYKSMSAEPMSVSLPAPSITTPDGVDPTMVVGDPVAQIDMKNVAVYANSINAVSYQGGDAVVAFDVVFSVSMTCDDGSTKTYQVVKRIGIDRMKMADDAMRSTPVSIIETKKPPAPERFLVSTDRARTIAGLK